MLDEILKAVDDVYNGFMEKLTALKVIFISEIDKQIERVRSVIKGEVDTFMEALRKDLYEVQGEAAALSLEQITILIHKRGQEWVVADQIADRMKDLKDVKLSRLKMAFIEQARQNGSKMTDERAETMAKSTNEWEAFINEMADARKAAEQAKISYDAYKNLFDARRTQEATEREKMKRGI
jgi:hypothetical protein